VVVLAGDEQERRAVLAEVHLGRGVRVEVRECCLEQDATGTRDRVAVVRLACGLIGHRVGERVAELVERQGDGAMVVGGVLEDRDARLELRERERRDPLQRRGVDADAGRAEPAVEQHLGERAAERVPMMIGGVSSSRMIAS